MPSQALTPNDKNIDYTDAYWTLMAEEPKYRCCIQMSEYPKGYCIYVFWIFGKVGGHVVQPKKGGHTRFNLKFDETLTESVMVILYASFPSQLKIDNARNVQYARYHPMIAQYTYLIEYIERIPSKRNYLDPQECAKAGLQYGKTRF